MASPAPRASNESQRLERLLALGVLDSEAEPLFDALTRAASLLTGAPIALLTLVDDKRQWFKANIGLEEVKETSRDVAFCSYTILDDDLFVVPDALEDPRFADNPLVTGAPYIRFYAGAPITLADGMHMGALCVIDREPRQLSREHAAILSELARAATEALEQRKAALERTELLHREALLHRLLMEDRTRLESILDAAQAGTWEWNIQTGEMRFNEQWAAILGYAMEDLDLLSASSLRHQQDHVRHPFPSAQRNLTHPDDVEQVEERLLEHLNGQRPLFDCEVRLRHKDGYWIWGLLRGRVISHGAEGSAQWMYGTLVDVSERKLMERRLHESEAFLDRAGRVAGVGGWQLDLASQELTWSEQTCLIHDLPPGYHPNVEEAVHFYAPEARTVMERAVAKGASDGTGWDLELPLVTAKGRHIWVRAVGAVEYQDGKPRWLVGAIQDITARKQAIEGLQRSERRFRKLFEESLGLICTHDLNGVLLSVNPAAAEVLNYNMGELLGRSLKDFMPPELRPTFDEYLRRVTHEGIAKGLLQVIAKDGRLLTWQYHNTLDTEGDEPYVLGHAQDVTDRILHESQLREWSVRDSLTGLFNRRYLGQVAANLRNDESWGCIAIDLEGFKVINDTYGHQKGDEMLVAMGRFLTDNVRPDDIVIRSGGDEFLVLLPRTSEAETQGIIQRIDAAREHAPIRFTLGHAMRTGSATLDAALVRADDELYQVRRSRGYRGR
ncbi:PAS domain S-box protein [Dyella sp. ASV21]|uniref:PAS domain S-box protein n=1 Tax=Dyella sp. ASV21 TaxID=2795114 RepID=UPI0018ED3B49|nr:PAS domain S-box protein [Dyella sp. ASV21]